MKKVLLVRGIVSAVLVFGLTILGCNNDPDPAPAPAPTKYTVTFATGEGGGTPPAAMSADEGTNITLPRQETMTAPTGKTFDGWSIGAAGSSYTVKSNITATAQWKGPAQPTGRQVHVRHMATDPRWKDEIITKVVIHEWDDKKENNLGQEAQTARNLDVAYNGTWRDGLITKGGAYILAVTVGAGDNEYTAYSGKLEVYTLTGTTVLFYDGLDVVEQD